MNKRIVIAAAALCGLTVAAAPAAGPDRLAFRNVASWIVSNNRTLFVDDAAGQWYRVDLAAPCEPLGKAAAIALATPPGGGFETASRLLTGGGPCMIGAIGRVDAGTLPLHPIGASGGVSGR